MIREYAPILLIPAAWAMTFATMIYPGIDTYWIQHMHYFMILFLTGFTLLSWKKMNENPVLDIWRKIIAAGILFTALGALSFTLTDYTALLGGLSLGYWLLTPGIGCLYSAKEMAEYKENYKSIGYAGLIAITLAAAGIYTNIDSLIGLSIAVAAISQTYSIIIAARLDENL